MAARSGTTPALYFHVGLGKTGSTYLQYHFFPALKGVHYVQRTKYAQYRTIIESSKENKLLFSREFDRQLEREVSAFASFYPGTHPIIILRPPEDWLASQYRRFVKNGFSGSLSDFVDVENDRGIWGRDELLFSRKIRSLDQHFGPEPLVLLYEDLKRDPYAFFDRIAEHIGATYEREAIDLNPSHRSYQERQLKVMRKVAGKLGLEPQPRRSSSVPIKRIQEWSRRLLSYSVLYGTYLLPEAAVPRAPLIPQEALKRVRDFAAEDWEYCRERASR